MGTTEERPLVSITLLAYLADTEETRGVGTEPRRAFWF